MRTIDAEALTGREFAVPYAVAGWTAATVLALTMMLEQVGVASGGQASVWFHLGGGLIAALMAALAWVLVSEPIRLEARVEEATAKLQRSEARYRLLYDQAPLAYMTLDATGRVQDVNDRFEELLGHPAEDVEGRPIEDLFLPGEAAPGELAERFRKQGRLDGEEFALETVDAEIRWVRLTMRSAEPAEGQSPEILAMAMDVTERKQAETQLENYARELEHSHEDLKQFAYAASHDMREPLRTIKGYLGLLDERFGDGLGEEAEEFIGQASAGVERMHALITSLLEYSRVGTDETLRTPVNLERAWTDVADNLSLRIDEAGAQVDVGHLPTVQGDPAQLRRLLQNLVANAIEHGGPQTYVRVRAVEDGEGPLVLVEDDGPGIPDDERDQIFDVFHRVDARPEEEGTGMGLAICRRIVDRHGGEIEVTDSELGGACFRFRLPTDPIQAEVPLPQERSDTEPDSWVQRLDGTDLRP